MLGLTFRRVDRANWPDLESLFEARGGPKSCWCMLWRARGAEVRQTKGFERKAALSARVDAGVPIGLLGYIEDVPVAWCSIAPRPTYRPLGGPEGPARSGEVIFSLACLFIRRDLRGSGAAPCMIAAAIAHAREEGAAIVEAYPVDPDSPSYRFMGYVPAFKEAGFEEIGMAGSRRHVMRFTLTRE